MKGTGRFMALGMEMGFSVGIPVYAGYKLDEWMETSYIILIGLFVGLIAAGNSLWRAVKKSRTLMDNEQQDN